MARSSKGAGRGWTTAARWTPAMAREALDALERSGETIARFASLHGLDAQRLYAWRRRMDSADVQRATFIEVVPRAPVRIAPPVEILMRTGEIVRVSAGFDEDVLASVVAVLRGATTC